MALGIIVTSIFNIQLTFSIFQSNKLGEVMELVPVPDFKSGGSWPWSGMVRSIRMLSRQK
jgi:hypothetical protein